MWLNLVVHVFKVPGRFIQYRSYKNYPKTTFLPDLRRIDWEIVEKEPDIDTAVHT